MQTPAKGEVFKHLYTGKHYAFVSMFQHDPRTCAPRDYIIVQVYGHYSNDVEIIPVGAWEHLFELAWGPLIECKFCGFRRMMPCKVRQTCPNLRDAPLEDAIAIGETV